VGLTTNLRMEYRLRLSYANEPPLFAKLAHIAYTY